MEPNIPVGSAEGVARAMQRAVAGGEREQRGGASGKWVAHWKMVHIVRPVWRSGPGQSARARSRRSPTAKTPRVDLLEPAPRTAPGRASAQRRHSVGNVRAGHAGRRTQAADNFGNDDVLCLMEDGHRQIRLSILWEWLHKTARFTETTAAGVKAVTRSPPICRRLLHEE
jgi:malate synthase